MDREPDRIGACLLGGALGDVLSPVVTGKLLGAMGAPLPRAWLDALELRDLIERTARELRDTVR